MKLMNLMAVLVFAAGCATDRKGCVVDSLPEPPLVSDNATTCSFAWQCPSGTCTAGKCARAAPMAECSFDFQCPEGSCQAGACSLIPSTEGH